MADNSLNVPVVVQSFGIMAASLPSIFSPAYQQYVLTQSTDFTKVAGKANEAGQGAYDAQVKNDQQDVMLVNHEIRITAAESDISSLDSRLTTAESDIDFLTGEVIDIQATLADHETRIDALEYAVTRKKSEVIYTGISLPITTTATNLISLIKTLTPTSGTLAPFFDTTNNKMVVYNENKSVQFKLSLVGSWPGGTGNRSMQLTFSGSVPDTLVNDRTAITTTDNILLATFFSVDKNGFLATNGSTMTIKSNGATFTATTIKIIAEQ